MKEIYLDNSATTRPLPEVREAMLRTLDMDYGNPSAMHHKGVEAEHEVRMAREAIAATLRVNEKEIVFTSGGTESNNQAILGTALARGRQGKHIITTAIEHPSVANTVAFLEKEGYEITRLPVDRWGLVSPETLKEAMRPDTILVSVMMVNNEIGTIEPVEALAKVVHAANEKTIFHVDAIQAYGKLLIRPRSMGIDLLSVSGHKIHGPKGIGFLYIRDKVKLSPILFGGGQQRDLRSGTENVPGIAGLGAAAKAICEKREEHVAEMIRLRDMLAEGLAALPDVTIQGALGAGLKESAAPQIISASFADVRSEVLLHALEDRGIYVSAGSACSSNGAKHASATLTAIGLRPQLREGTLRFSLGIYNTEEDIRETLAALAELLPMLRRYTRR